MDTRIVRLVVATAVVIGTFGSQAKPAQALDRMCDPANENCRTILLNYIRAELVGIDVGFWFMEDARYSNELIKKWNAGVPVRVLVDTRANASTPANATRLAEMDAAGIPMRHRAAKSLMHWKAMLFAGQNVVEFSGANYSSDAWNYGTTAPYVNYTDEAIYFTDDLAVVNSFRTKFDELWTNTSSFANYANINTPLLRVYGWFPKAPEMNFAPAEGYASRAINRYDAERQKIDVIMYRITDRRHSDAIIAARGRGIPVRLITEPEQYRDVKRVWHSWNIDRLYMAGVEIKNRAHAGLNHQKSVILYGQGMTIFGSSNWTSPSDRSQEEHNYFTVKPTIFQWYVDQFERKWNNSAGVIENTDFAPLPPDKPAYNSPANAALGVKTSSVVLKWHAGFWAHKYDVYLGTDPNNLQQVLIDQDMGPSLDPLDYKKFTATNLSLGTTYYWRVVSRTMANLTKTGDLWSFTTEGTAPPPASTTTSGPGDIVIHARNGVVNGSAWSIVSDASAAGSKRLWNKNVGAAKVLTALSAPASYVEFTFDAVAGQPYRLWMRGKGDDNSYLNDSVFVQFSDALTSSGATMSQIGTTSASEYNLEDCGGCGLSGWGWQDNGWSRLGPTVYFATTGPQTLRIQSREDGLSIDQILLSPSLFLNASPGLLKNDTTVFAATQGP